MTVWKDKLESGWSNCSGFWKSISMAFILPSVCMASVVPEIQALPGNQKLPCPSGLAWGRSAAHRIGWPCLLRWSFHLLCSSYHRCLPWVSCTYPWIHYPCGLLCPELGWLLEPRDGPVSISNSELSRKASESQRCDCRRVYCWFIASPEAVKVSN